MWHDDILGTIGDTPLVRLNRVTKDLPGTVLAKVEFFNPGASVKDRIGTAMIEAAEEQGELRPGGTIIEGTSGNTGAGLALAAIAKGYHCIFTTTDKQSQEKVDVLRALGAEVIICPSGVEPDDPRSYYSRARQLNEEIPNSAYLNQYDNPSNTEAHYRTTGPELWEQTDGRITHFVAGAGTGGTISGVGRYLKEQSGDVQVVGVDPEGSLYHKYFHTGDVDKGEVHPYLTEGLGEDIIADNLDVDAIDDYVQLGDKPGMLMTRKLARREGLFVGQSSGLVTAGALQWMGDHRDEISDDDVIVVLLPDSGFRYLSKTYNEDWMRDHGFVERSPNLTVDEVLNRRAVGEEVVAVGPDATLDEAIGRMTERGISQLPVISAGSEVVGSLTESRILNRLIEEPEARDSAVSAVMDEPLPIVPRSMHLENLSDYLERGTGAVLVEAGDDERYDILTKSDLISALSHLSNGERG
jgi:cystathionine beta-synthase